MCMMDIPIYNEQLTGLGEFNFEKRKDFAAVSTYVVL
jgi:hypothetical protein